MEPTNETWARNAYRTTSSHEMSDRHLVLRGGALDGQSWTGVAAVGKRVFCGTGTWSKEGLYLVTAHIEVGPDGTPMNVAIPAFAADAGGQG
jgi:hypothetical protein